MCTAGSRNKKVRGMFGGKSIFLVWWCLKNYDQKIETKTLSFKSRKKSLKYLVYYFCRSIDLFSVCTQIPWITFSLWCSLLFLTEKTILEGGEGLELVIEKFLVYPVNTPWTKSTRSTSVAQVGFIPCDAAMGTHPGGHLGVTIQGDSGGMLYGIWTSGQWI